jgi:DNA-binding winged helix-turn-helix (wHTH) protein
MNTKEAREPNGMAESAGDGRGAAALQRQGRKLLLGSADVGGKLLLSHLVSKSGEWFVLHHAGQDAEAVTEQAVGDRRALTMTIVLVAASFDERERLRGELPARVAAAINGRASIDRNVIEVEDLRIDRDGHRVSVGGGDVSLSLREFNLLMALVERRDTVQSREALLGEAWGFGTRRNSRTIDTNVKRLRDKLGRAGRLIRTVRGVGYCFKTTPTAPQARKWRPDSTAGDTHDAGALRGVVTRAVA